MDMLVRTPQPNPTESLLGYVLRVSEANGYEAPTGMLISSRAARRQGKSVEISIDKLASMVGCDVARLRPLANRLEGSDRLYFLGRSIGNKTGRNALRLNRPGFCPHCVADAGYIDAVWDLEFAVACPKHHCAVIDKCHSCDRPLTHLRPGILTCNCHANLADAPETKVSKRISCLMEIIFAKARGIPLLSLKNEMYFPNEHFDSLSIEDFFVMLTLLARLALYLPIVACNDDNMLNAEKVSDALADWPNGFHSLLRSIDEKFSTPNYRTGDSIPRFKHFYVPMFSLQNRSKRFQFLHDEFSRFNRLGLTNPLEAGRQNIGNDEEQPNWVSKRYIVLRWGISMPALDEFLAQGALPMKVKKNGGCLEYQIDISKFEPLRHADEQLLPRSEAALRSGIPPAVLTQLRKCGFYKNTCPVTTLGHYSTRDLDVFCQSLIERTGLIEADDLRPGTSIRLSDVLGKSNPANAKRKVNFIASYLSGKISALGRTGDSVDEIQFSKDAVRNLGFAIRIKRSGSKEESVRPS